MNALLVFAADVILPPRPNLGPEPWSEPAVPPWVLGLGVVLTAILTGFGAILVLQRRRRRRGRRPTTVAPARPVSNSPMALLGDEVRELLVGRFGPTWAARTTEEIAASSELSETLGPALFERLVPLLQAADRAKFALDQAPDAAQEAGADEAAVWSDFVAELAAGATSTTSG